MNKKTIYALGFFDGVHMGHQALLQACRELAENNRATPGVVTFTTHPDGVVSGTSPKLICSLPQRRQLLKAYGMQRVTELPFDHRMMEMPWQAFVHLLRTEHQAAGFVCGSDFRFGKRGEGTAQLLQQYCEATGIPCQVVPEQVLEGVTLSSTYIRGLLENGEMERAARFLGHPYAITGTVVAGRQLGRTLGTPTANILLPEGLICPKHGVYACKAIVDEQEYLAVTNIGNRPTVGGHQIRAESWLLDFDGDLYGKNITLEFFAYLRAEEKFPTLEALQEEIQRNAAQTRKILENS